jgi:bifunctional ADP-heptose synthase (sugar kinase/adenylyltransferase)
MWHLGYEFNGDRSKGTFAQDRPGSAGKIAAHACSLGAQVALYAIIGEDVSGNCLKKLLQLWNVSSGYIITDKSRPTVVRNRLYSIDVEPEAPAPLVRFDEVCRNALSQDVKEKLRKSINTDADVHCIVIADFGIGTITSDLICFLGKLAKDKGVPLVIYPARASCDKYMSIPVADKPPIAVLCPNAEEAWFFAQGTSESSDIQIEARRNAVYGSLLERYNFFNLFVVRGGSQGVTLLERAETFPKMGNVSTIRPHPNSYKKVNSVDTGTTFVSSFAVALSGGFSYYEAAAFANFVGGLQNEEPPEEIVTLEDIMMNLSARMIPVVKWEGTEVIGGKEFQKISSIMQDLINKGGIYLSDAVEKFPCLPEVLPIVAVAQKSVTMITNISKLIQNRLHSENVLLVIYGESRTGKTELARSLHDYFERKGNFKEAHCNRDKLEDVLSLIESCNGGDTVLLDELGQETAIGLRGALVDVLDKLRKSKNDIIIIAATSIRPEKVEANDVFKRFNGPFEVAPLREVRENIPYLIACEAQIWNNANPGQYVSSITVGALQALLFHEYPNNFKDLSTFVQSAFVAATTGHIRLQHLPESVKRPGSEEEDGIDINFVF